jgi:hypothetical protein
MIGHGHDGKDKMVESWNRGMVESRGMAAGKSPCRPGAWGLSGSPHARLKRGFALAAALAASLFAAFSAAEINL